MTIPYVDQSPEDLRLTMVEGDLDYEQFQIMERADYQSGLVDVSASIIGASHVLSFAHGGVLLHEIFACQKVEGNCSYPLFALPRSVDAEYGALRHRIDVNVQSLSAGRTLPLLEWLERAAQEDTHGRALEYEFPIVEAGTSAKTLIAASDVSIGGGAAIFTAHCYPSYRQVVFTRTIVEPL